MATLKKLTAISKTDYRAKGLRAMTTLSTSSKKPLFAVVASLFLVMLTALSASAGNAAPIVHDNFFKGMNSSGTDTLQNIKCSLQGAFGWMLIAFGILVAVWEYFVQRQGHMIVAAIVGVIVVILLGRVLPGTCT